MSLGCLEWAADHVKPALVYGLYDTADFNIGYDDPAGAASFALA
jgi:hypothetical protein